MGVALFVGASEDEKPNDCGGVAQPAAFGVSKEVEGRGRNLTRVYFRRDLNWLELHIGSRLAVQRVEMMFRCGIKLF